jgi:hypothetical protein
MKLNKQTAAEKTQTRYTEKQMSDGTEVCLRHLTVKEVRDLFAQKSANTTENLRRSDRLVMLSVVDHETKERVFNKESELSEMEPAFLNELATLCVSINKLAPDADTDEKGEDQGN